jgi:hypothetical protein
MKKLSIPQMIGTGLAAAAVVGVGIYFATHKKDTAQAAGGAGGTTAKKLTGADFDKNTQAAYPIAQANGAPAIVLPLGQSFFMKAPDGAIVTTISSGAELDFGAVPVGGVQAYPVIAVAPGSDVIKGTFADDMHGTNEHTFEIPYTVK